MAFLLTGVVIFAGLPMIMLKAQEPYKTGFAWFNAEEDLHEWPLEAGLTKTNAGIGTAGFSYRNYYYNDEGRIVLEFDFSMFGDDPTGLDYSSAWRLFREQWDNAVLFIDPNLATKVDDTASFFMMSYPKDATSTAVSLSRATKAPGVDNVYKLSVNDVYPVMPTGSDYMKSKLYLVLKGNVTRVQLNEDYAVELRYTNNRNQIYDQKGTKGSQVLGSYFGYVPAVSGSFDVSVNNDDVTLKTIAPFQTASMPGVIPNPVLPPDMMRSVAQSVIYDNIRGKLHVYYRVAPNHYIYTNRYANNGYFLSSWLGIRQVMDSRIYDALKPDANGVVGQMRMFDLDGQGSTWNVITDIKVDEFAYSPTTENPSVGTRSYMMVPADFKTDITNKAVVPTNQKNNVKNVYLHGHKKESDYVRFIYDVDKNKMDALFAEANSSTFSISTSYISDRPTETTQTEYRLEATQDIVIPKGAMVIFDLPEYSRAVFKAGLANNYERTIGNLQTKRPSSEMNNNGVDPSDYGKAYTITPYSIIQGGFVLTPEAGLKISAGESISLTMFDGTSPETVKMTVATGMHGVNRVDYYLTKHATNENKIHIMPNSNVRSGIIINRSANPPHVDEFFTDSTAITGHSKYPDALVSVRKATDGAVFKEAYSAATPETFIAEGDTYEDAGYLFTLDIPAGVEIKKDMALRFSNAAAGYFRSVPSTYRAHAGVTFDQNDGSGTLVQRIVPINRRAYGEAGYVPNGFENGSGQDNILWLDSAGNAVPATTAEKYLSDYEGRPITDTESWEYTLRQFHSAPELRAGYTFLGWSTKPVESMGAAAFTALPELNDVSGWDAPDNYKFTATSPVDASRTVYAVWEKDLDSVDIVLHNNNGGADVTHTVSLPLASITGGSPESLTAYLGKDGNVLYDAGFAKGGAYFVGWSEDPTVSGITQVHQLYTNGSKVQMVGENGIQLQLNEEPKSSYASPDEHFNPWQTLTSSLVNNNGTATVHLYAQYKPLSKMTATKQWYGLGQKEIYEGNPSGYTGTPDPAHFPNSDVAMVLMRTTEGKTLDPNKYEIVLGFYKQGTDGAEWEWPLQESHDANGRKYSYLMTEFNAQQGGHTEGAIIDHFNDKRTWSSLYITMIGQSDDLSKYTAITLTDGGGTKSYLAVSTSNQPTAIQYVNTPTNYAFVLKNFQVSILPPMIHRIQENHTEIVIDSPTDGAKYLYLRLSDTAAPVSFSRSDQNEWSSNDNDVKIAQADGKLTISSNTGTPFNFVGRAEQRERVYAFFTIDNNDDDINWINKYASREIQPYDNLPALQDIRQVPHIKDVNGNITHNVISAKIPAGSYAGADYTLGYMENGIFVPVTDGEGNPITVKPDATEKLTFNVPTGKLDQDTTYIIRGVDPAETFMQTDFDGPAVDLTAPGITATDINLETGDPIVTGPVTTDDSNAIISYKVTKGGVEAPLPEGITFDPATGKFSGKTADVLDPALCGDYTITISATDVYGNVSTEDITLTITQKSTTPNISSITQHANDAQGNASLTVKGQKGAEIKLYGKDGEGNFYEVDVPGVTGKTLETEGLEIDGKYSFVLPQADVARFYGQKMYVTQKMANKLESNKIDGIETINRSAKKKVSGANIDEPGGAIVIDNDPPTPLQLVQPLAGKNLLKITNVSADDNLADVKDIDRITLQIANYLPCELTRKYDEQGESTGVWTCNQGRDFVEAEEEVTVIVDPNTGATETKKVGVLNFTLAGGATFSGYQVITATYYDYLGNVSAPVTTSVPKLPDPIPPYDMTAVNSSNYHPTETAVKGKADPGAEVSITVDGTTYKAIVDVAGEFALGIPKQLVGTELTVTSKLNTYTKSGTVKAKNAQADDYEPTATTVEKQYGQATAVSEVLGAVQVEDYPIDAEERPIATLDEGAVLPDGNTLGESLVPVVVTYPDGTTDKVKVTVKVSDSEVPNIAAENATVVEGRAITPIPISVTDNVAVGEVSVTGLPAGLTYNVETKQIEGTPTEITDWDDTNAPNYEEERTFTTTITAKDTSDNVATKDITINVLRDTDRDGEPDVTDTDDDGDGYSDAYEIAAGSNPKDANSIPAAIIVPVGEVSITPAEQEVVEGESVVVIDVDVPATSAVTVSIPEGSGLTYDAATKQITGKPTVTDWGVDEKARVIEIVVTVVDVQGATVVKTIQITVQRDSDGDGTPDVDEPTDVDPTDDPETPGTEDPDIPATGESASNLVSTTLFILLGLMAAALVIILERRRAKQDE